jgi:protocatechuate 3,4-dioxygenase beta subunit
VIDRYERPGADTHPPLLSPGYRSTVLRAPSRPPVPIRQGLGEITGPMPGAERIEAGGSDLTGGGAALGQRIVVTGRVLDGDGRPLPDTLVEIWQANAAGRYAHPGDDWPAPLDPAFTGTGRAVTDGAGRYRFTTIKPGAYPWKNHHNAWRPAHLHFSLFGVAFAQRLVTQMYFPDDPLFDQDPIFNAVPAQARHRLVSRFDLAETVPEWALAFTFDLVLRGRGATPWEGAA